MINDDNQCTFPGDTCSIIIANENLIGVFDDNCECVVDNSSMIEETDWDKKLLQVIDISGKEKPVNNQNSVLLYIYDDVSIEKKYILKSK